MESARKPVVLLIEPDDDGRVMYAEYLALCGFHPVVTDDAADGLSRAPSADVVVTGIRIRGAFDGIELIRRLRQDARTKVKPIVCLTACTFEPHQMRARAAGCDAFLPKPCLPDVLVLEVQRRLALAAVRLKSVRATSRIPTTRRTG